MFSEANVSGPHSSRRGRNQLNAHQLLLPLSSRFTPQLLL